MAINYAEKYSSKVDERMSLKEMTNIGLNTDYDWDGVNAIYVYDVDTVPLNDYTMEGTNRYGTPVELGDSKTRYELTTDKGFAFTIDERNKKSNRYYIFGINIEKREIYIKVKIESYDNKIVLCMSFHFAKYPLKWAYK